MTSHLVAALSCLCAATAHGAAAAKPPSDGTSNASPARTSPNILWISLEDITPMMGCYGDDYARTPVFDRLAAEGTIVWDKTGEHYGKGKGLQIFADGMRIAGRDTLGRIQK